MQSAWETFKEVGFIAWPIVFFGMIGGLIGVVALVLTASRSAAAKWAGVAAIALGVLCSMLGGFGMYYGRAKVDAAISGESVTAIQKERIQREGYREARGAPKIGLFFAFFPMFAGVVAMFAAPAKKRDPEPDQPAGIPPAGAPPAALQQPKSSGGLALPIGATIFALLSAAFAFSASRSPLPGRDIPVDAPVWAVIDGVDRVEHAKDNQELADACRKLEQGLSREPPPQDLKLVEGLRPATHKCVEEQRKAAALLGSIDLVARALSALSRSPLIADDPEAQKLIQKDLDEVKQIAEAQPPPSDPFADPASPRPRGSPPKIKMGSVQVSGRLPPEVIQRIVRQNFGRFRLCYENGLRSNPKLEGKVSVRFVIGRDGSVSNVGNGGSDLPDGGVVSCVVRAFYGLSFPQPEGGIVTVTYPILFKPGG